MDGRVRGTLLETVDVILQMDDKISSSFDCEYSRYVRGLSFWML